MELLLAAAGLWRRTFDILQETPGRAKSRTNIGVLSQVEGKMVRQMARWIMIMLLTLQSLVGGAVDLSLYGGAFESSSIIAYSEVVQTCFGGLVVGSCEPSSPNWLYDHLDQYSNGMTGTYCTSCCSNTDVAGDTWIFTCPLISLDFAEFVNKFGWEFRFGRAQTADDREVVTCTIPRTSCVYDDYGVLSEPCEADGSFLAGYVLTVEVMTIERGLQVWKSVQSCSVESEESDTQPESISEAIIMTQVYASGSGIEAGWAILIALFAFGVLSYGVRYARADRCVVCGHQLIWFPTVCLPCKFFGYTPPSKEVAEIVGEKRAVVLPEPTLAERLGTVRAGTSKVFVQATQEILPPGVVSKITSVRNATLGKSRAEGAGKSNDDIDNSRGERLETNSIPSLPGSATTQRIKGWLSAMSKPQGMTLPGRATEDESRVEALAETAGTENTRVGQNTSRVVVSQATTQNDDVQGVARTTSKPKPLRRSPEWCEGVS